MEQELELDRLKLETKYREKCVEKEVRAQMFQMLAEVVEDIATDAMTELISVQQYSMKTVSDLMLVRRIFHCICVTFSV